MLTTRVIRKFLGWFGAKDYVEQTAYLVLLLFTLLTVPPLVAFAAWPLLLALAVDLVLLPFQLVGRATKAAATAARRRAEERDRQRLAAAAALRRAREGAERPKSPTRQEVRASPRAQYEQLLRDIDADPVLDDAAKAAARLEAKRRYLARLDRVL